MFLLSDIKIVREKRTILAIEQLSIPTDKLTVILGHNGSGKSTLVNLLCAQQQPDSGSVLLNGRSVASFSAKSLARELAFLPQKLPTSAGLSVRELVRLGRFPWRGALGRWRQIDEQIIDQSMAKTGVSDFSKMLADRRSGGERQRAWVAMLLAQQTPLLILDEPTSALDVHHQYQLMQLLAQLNRDQGCGIIVILHDLNLSLRFANHVIALKEGAVAFAGGAELLLDEKCLSALYNTDIRLIDHPKPLDTSKINKVAIVCA